MTNSRRNNDAPLRHLTPELLDLVRQHDAWFNHWATERDTADKPTEPVFHYTNWSGFRGILESQSFWLHSIFDMNDESKLDYGLGIAHDLLAKRNIAAIMADDELGIAFLGPQLSPELVPLIKKRFNYYSMSFGERDDADQWLTYGDKHRGVAIGVAPKIFANVSPQGAPPEAHVYVAKVLYGPSECIDRHREAIDVTFDILEVARQRGLVKTQAAGLAFIKAMAVCMDVSLIWNSITTKSEGWRHERELRMLAMNDLENPHLPIRCREDGRSYVAIPIPLRRRGTIAEIMVGADADTGVEDAVAKLLLSAGISDLPPIVRPKRRTRTET